MMSQKLQFFIKHISVSLFVLVLCFTLIYYVWYPNALLTATGALKIILIILAIDLIIGPILGFMVYKPAKKTLKFDLSIIFALQIMALSYGIYTIGQGRPAYIVYNVDRFEVIRYNELIIEDTHYPHTLISFWQQPQFFAVDFSKNLAQRNQDMFEEVLAGISIAQRPERYVPLKKVKTQIQQRSQSLAHLNNFNNQMDVNKILKKYPEANAWVPLQANHQDMVVLINKEQAKVIQIVNLKPWS